MSAPKPNSGQVNPLALLEETGPEDPAQVIRPWERMSREGDAAWAWFVTFRDMAYPEGPTGKFVPRNLAALSRSAGVSHDYLRQLSSSFKWMDRAGAYDRALDAAKVQAELSELVKMRGRHLRLLGKARTLVEAELDKYLRKATTDPDMNSMSVRELRDMLELVIKHERLIHGEHTDHLKLDAEEWNLEDLSLEELELLQSLQKKARGGG